MTKRAASAALLALISWSALADGSATGGPVTPWEVALTTSGRAWSTGTGVFSIPAQQQLDVTLTNPANSGCNAVVLLRKYENTTTTNLQFVSFTNPTTITANAKAPGNRQVGTAPNSGLSLGFTARAAGSMGGTAGVNGVILGNEEMKVDQPFSVPPGTSFGVSISGLSGLLANAVPVTVTLSGVCA